MGVPSFLATLPSGADVQIAQSGHTAPPWLMAADNWVSQSCLGGFRFCHHVRTKLTPPAPSHAGQSVDFQGCRCSRKHLPCFCPLAFHVVCPVSLNVALGPPGQRWPALPQGGILASLGFSFTNSSICSVSHERTRGPAAERSQATLKSVLVIFLCQKRGRLPAFAWDPSVVRSNVSR